MFVKKYVILFTIYLDGTVEVLLHGNFKINIILKLDGVGPVDNRPSTD